MSPTAALERIQQELAESVPLLILLGAALGAVMVNLLTGTIGESSNESLEALVLGALQVIVPVGVNLIWICRSAALRLAETARRRLRRRSADPSARPATRPDWRPRDLEITIAALSALLMIPWFGGALLLGGLLATPRAELGLVSELRELLRLMTPADLSRCVVSTGVFAAAAQAVILHKGAQVRESLEELPRLIADAVPEAILLVVGLAVAWLALLSPLHGTYA